MTNKIKTSVVITVVICITLLEALALYKGINGLALTAVIGALCALAGNVLPTPKILK